MRVLYEGTSGDDVTAWQNFLRGLKFDSEVVSTGQFDSATKAETQQFQSACGLKPDGTVGPLTLGKALGMGYAGLLDERVDQSSANWPPPPNFKPMSYVDRQKTFGAFSFVPAGMKNNPEAIKIIDDWPSKNIVNVSIPQLKNLKVTQVPFNRLASTQLQSLFEAWEEAGLIDQVVTWGGSWAPRFIRGSRSVLSNHAWGTAFDINVQWNMLGVTPALVGSKGSVRQLVTIANEHGFFWGGHFSGRPDGMHFEVATLLP